MKCKIVEGFFIKIKSLFYFILEKPGEPLVQCCSNLCGGVWFHEGCAPIDDSLDPTVTQDWFCSPACQGDGTYIYCYCKEQRGGQMVQCALMDQCRRHEWYHKDCLSLSEQSSAEQCKNSLMNTSTSSMFYLTNQWSCSFLVQYLDSSTTRVTLTCYL